MVKEAKHVEEVAPVVAAPVKVPAKGQVNTTEGYEISKRNDEVEALLKKIDPKYKPIIAEENTVKHITCGTDVTIKYAFIKNPYIKLSEWKAVITQGTRKIAHYKIFNSSKINSALSSLIK